MERNSDQKPAIRASRTRRGCYIGALAIALLVCAAGCKPSNRELVLNAAITDNVELLRSLDKKGADLNAQYPERFHWTPLIAAIYHQSTNVIAYLINRGVDVTKRAGDGQTTALMMAITWDDTNTVELLLRKAPSVLARSEDWQLVQSAARASGGDQEIRRQLSAIIDAFIRTNLPVQRTP